VSIRERDNVAQVERYERGNDMVMTQFDNDFFLQSNSEIQ